MQTSLAAIPDTVQEAAKLQLQLAALVRIGDDFGQVKHVAGLDAAYPVHGPARAAVALYSFPGLSFIEGAVVSAKAPFPYIPGYFCFREGPLVVSAMNRLSVKPDIILADGQGLAHPRRMGLACWVGLIADTPAIGVAKTPMAGFDAEPGADHGDKALLCMGEEVVGYALRVRKGVRPVYVSPGHRIGPESAAEFVLACSPKYRTPEPIRRAHFLAGLSVTE